ncbi:hypothetical protein DUI87_08038 [Hirundo rustica rustica]|uniref:ribonuclease H n=1 Tax=Hirundo rustica rustica TaxID=333673 RepID=A0A3M0KWM2_HIRRU|nr:hypothetical protein DUI87_08038 [Hirundo rustica rustica]
MIMTPTKSGAQGKCCGIWQQYATFIATINADNNRETVSSIANKLRNYESVISGPMQAQVSAMVKELREEMREMREEMRRNNSHVALVQVTGPRVRAQRPPARERGYTPQADLWFFLCDHGKDMGKWDGKLTSALAARVRELKERNTNQRGSTKMKVASTSHDQAASPIWPVRKSDGEWRLTVDYCALNEVTPPLSAAVPDMLELQYELESKAAKWYTTMDIANAFFSIPLAAECRPEFAFTWRGVEYTWN